jgi:hypothetical protein
MPRKHTIKGSELLVQDTSRTLVPQRMVIMTAIESRAKVQREPRRQLRKKPAWITVDNGMTKRECLVLDVSPGGARIATDDAMDVRDTFELALVPDHPKRELCEVVWRRGKTYGIKFLPLASA